MSDHKLHHHRFTQQDRLRQAKDFQQVFKKNIRSYDRYFTILLHKRETNATPAAKNRRLLKKDTSNQARLGLAIAKRILKRAVDRNRVKRIVRESFRQTHLRHAPVDIVVMVQKSIDISSNEILFQSLRNHWQWLETKL